MSLVPAMRRFEKRYAGRLRVRRVDVTGEGGARARRDFGVNLVPFFILLDSTGKERWRGSIPPRADDLLSVGIEWISGNPA